MNHVARVAKTLMLVAVATAAQGQVFVSEDFNYPNFTQLTANWSNFNGMSLEMSEGLQAPSASHNGLNTVHSWIGGTFSITPTDSSPLVLRADLYYNGISGQRNTVGLRTGINPLFEMGFYNADPANGLAARIFSFAGNENWVGLVPYSSLGVTPQWIGLEATFRANSVTVAYDLGADGEMDGFYTSQGAGYAAPFSDLRFGGPSGNSSITGFNVDNINLAVVPEPCAYAVVFGGLTLGGAIIRQRLTKRKSTPHLEKDPCCG